MARRWSKLKARRSASSAKCARHGSKARSAASSKRCSSSRSRREATRPSSFHCARSDFTSSAWGCGRQRAVRQFLHALAQALALRAFGEGAPIAQLPQPSRQAAELGLQRAGAILRQEGNEVPRRALVIAGGAHGTFADGGFELGKNVGDLVRQPLQALLRRLDCAVGLGQGSGEAIEGRWSRHVLGPVVAALQRARLAPQFAGGAKSVRKLLPRLVLGLGQRHLVGGRLVFARVRGWRGRHGPPQGSSLRGVGSMTPRFQRPWVRVPRLAAGPRRARLRLGRCRLARRRFRPRRRLQRLASRRLGQKPEAHRARLAAMRRSRSSPHHRPLADPPARRWLAHVPQGSAPALPQRPQSARALAAAPVRSPRPPEVLDALATPLATTPSRARQRRTAPSSRRWP